MYNPQKLHPISYISGLIEAIKQNIILVIIFVFFQMRQFDWSNPWNYLSPGIFTAIFLISFIANLLRVYKTRYWIEGQYFIMTSGVFNLERKELHIRRIQSMDTTQSMVNRLFGGVNLQIRTPSDGIELNTITREQSEYIREAVEKIKTTLTNGNNENEDEAGAPTKDTESVQEMLYDLSPKNLLLMSMTSGAILVAFVTLAPIVSALQNIINWSWLFGSVDQIIKNQVMATFLSFIVILLFCYIFGVLLTIIKYYGYKLRRKGDYLHIQYGLLNIRHITVPITRVQAVVENRSFLRTLFGYTSFSFIITSDQNLKNEDYTNGKVMILPFIKKNEAQLIITDLVPHIMFHQIKTGLPWRGFHRRFWIISVALLIVAACVHYFYSAWVWLPVLLVIAYLVMHSFLAIKHAGAAIKGEQIGVKQLTLFGFQTTYLSREKVIGYRESAHPLMLRGELSHFYFFVAKGMTYEAIGLRFEDIKNVSSYREWYLKEETL